MTRYEHAQFGWVTLVATAAGAVMLFAFTFYLGAPRALLVAAAVLVLPLLLFSSLTVVVTDSILRLSFGVGLIRKTIARSDIVRCSVVTNPWYYGWGIHRTPRGWLYNVSGSQAVEIELGNGSLVRVGTDEPEALCAALRSHSPVRPARGPTR